MGYLYLFTSSPSSSSLQSALTDQLPLSARLVGIERDRLFLAELGRLVSRRTDGALFAARYRHVDAVAVVRPRAELEPTSLVVEREPANVDGARRDEEPERNPVALAVRVDDYVRRKLAVNVLVRAVS